MKRSIRIANFSGYDGDRFEALAEILSSDDELDVLVGDYLAEITLAAKAADYQRDPSVGFIDRFVKQLRPHLTVVAERGLKVVTNAGALNPAGLAEALRSLCADVGVSLRVAHVEGDNLITRLPELEAQGVGLPHLDTGAPFSSWGREPITASAYLGAWGIAAALAAGADIIVTGRVTDASLTVGPSAWWHDWSPSDWDSLAGAVIAGHVIECGSQAVGGNFSGFDTISQMILPGWPIAEVHADGSAVITKNSGSGGAVTTDTVTAQLLYEIQGARYLNPDVTANIDSVRLEQVGHDRVRVFGTQGSPPPPTTKVAIFAPAGCRNVQTAFVTAPDIDIKVALLRAQLKAMLPEGLTELEVTALGAPALEPASQWQATVAVRVMIVAPDRETIAKADLAGLLFSLYLSSIPGFYLDNATRTNPEPIAHIEYWPAVLSVEHLKHTVVLDDGSSFEIAAAPETQLPFQPVHPEPDLPGELPLNDLVPMALGNLVYGRSGDKGGNCNVGIWSIQPHTYDWLRRYLSTDELRSLVPELKEIDVVRHEFPHLNAIHFVLKGLLGESGSTSTRVDQVGKAVGEYIRTKMVQVPVNLV